MAVFGKKKTVTSAKTSKKAENHVIVPIKGSQFDKDLKRFNHLKGEIAKLTTEQKSLEATIKPELFEEFIKLYTKNKANPGSFKVESESGERIMYLPIKKYTGGVDEERAEELRENYGETFVEETSEFIIDNDILEKHAEKLEELFADADFLTEEEKENMFTNKVSYKITSNAIDQAFVVGGKDVDVEDFIADINPQFQIKVTK